MVFDVLHFVYLGLAGMIFVAHRRAGGEHQLAPPGQCGDRFGSARAPGPLAPMR